MKRISVLTVSIFVTVFTNVVTTAAHAQNRVDLDDLNVKGELLNDNRLRLSSRDKHRLNDRISYRTNFRREITDGLDVPWPATGHVTDGGDQ